MEMDSGYLYIFIDEAFPNYVKVGKSRDPYNRLNQYNTDKPYKSTKPIYISRPLKYVGNIENEVLKHLRAVLIVDDIITAREWFNKDNLDYIKETIKSYENDNNLSTNLPMISIDYHNEKVELFTNIFLFYLETETNINYKEYLKWCNLKNCESENKNIFMNIINTLILYKAHKNLYDNGYYKK